MVLGIEVKVKRKVKFAIIYGFKIRKKKIF